jgi:hypothetical protein
MKRQLVISEMKAWKDRVGGLKTATRLIQNTLECSESKAEKLASGRYPSTVTPSEQIALAELMERPRDMVFKFSTGKRAS